MEWVKVDRAAFYSFVYRYENPLTVQLGDGNTVEYADFHRPYKDNVVAKYSKNDFYIWSM